MPFPYHIKIDGEGFVLVDETYHKKLQPPFAPRFSLKEGSYKDLSFFSFYQMNDWQGGEGEDKAQSLLPNSFLSSKNINVLDPGEIKLSPKVELFADLSHIKSELKIIEYAGKIIIYGPEGVGNTPKPFESSRINAVSERYLITPSSHSTFFSINKEWSSGLAGNDKSAEKEKVGTLTIRISAYTPGSREVTGPLSTANYVHTWINNFPYYFYQPNESITTKQTVLEKLDGYLFFNDGSGEVVKFNKLILKVIRTYENRVRIDTGPRSYTLKYDIYQEYFIEIEGLERGQFGTIATGHSKYSKANLYFPAIYGDREISSEFTPKVLSSCLHKDRLVLGCEGIIRSVLLENGKLTQKEYKKTTITDTAADLTRTVDAVLSISADEILCAIDGNLIYIAQLNATGTGDFDKVGTAAGIKKIVKFAVGENGFYFAGYKDNYYSVIGWTDKTSIIETRTIPHKIQVTDLIIYEGMVLYCGKTPEGKGVLYGFMDTLMLEIEEPGKDCGIRELNVDKHLFIPQNYGPRIQALTVGLEGQPGGVSAYCELPKQDGLKGIITDLEWFQDRIYFITGDNCVYMSNPERFEKEGELVTSKFYGEAELQDKIWFSVMIELKKDLPEGTKIEIISQRSEAEEWTHLGELDPGGRSYEVLFPEDYNSRAITLKLKLSSTSEKVTPIITSIAIRHVLTSLNKFVWTMAIRADNNLVLLDGKHDPRSGLQIMASLQEIIKDQKIISFTDVDDRIYRVIVTDADFSSPIVDNSKLEAMVSLELLES